MAEPISTFEPNRSIERFPSIEHVFKSRLGIPFPESPKDMPNEIILGSKVYGGLLDAIVTQENVDPPYKGGTARERSQFVGILKQDGSLVDSKVYVGTSMSTADSLAEIQRWFGPLFGRKVKPLTYWHTHQAPSLLTESDIAQRLGEDRKCLIYLHASSTDITSIVQTRAGFPHRIPISTAKKGFSIYDKLKEFYHSADANPQISDLSQFLEKYGHVLYMWKKPEGIHTVIEGIEAGEFMKGIKLNRIGLPLYLRRLLELYEQEHKQDVVSTPDAH